MVTDLPEESRDVLQRPVDPQLLIGGKVPLPPSLPSPPSLKYDGCAQIRAAPRRGLSLAKVPRSHVHRICILFK